LGHDLHEIAELQQSPNFKAINNFYPDANLQRAGLPVAYDPITGLLSIVT